MSEPRPASEHVVPVVLVVFGAASLLLGVTEAVAPGVFFEALGPFGARNDHYIRDAATVDLANAVLLFGALVRPGWRVAALTFTAVRYGLHAVNHVVDIGGADPAVLGPVDALALAISCGWLVLALVLAARARSSSPCPRPADRLP